LGSAAGRDFLGAELRRLGVPVVEEALLGTVYSTVIQLCEDKQHIYAEDLRVLAQETIAEAPQRLKLLAVTVTSSTGLPATAEVTLELGHGPAMRREHGDGPLDAAMRAIERLTNLKPEVENFSVVAATRGRDAIARGRDRAEPGRDSGDRSRRLHRRHPGRSPRLRQRAQLPARDEARGGGRQC